MSRFKTFIYAALACEAKPLIEFYKLKKETSVNAFSVFNNENIVLTVTGIGKCAMAAGVAYTQALLTNYSNPIFVNLGIAGHKNQPVGSIFLADKITDIDTGKHYYPPLIVNPPCPTLNLVSVSRPQPMYPETALCDMEGAAFYETATRFSSGELCHCIKVVSDNAVSPLHYVNAELATTLILDKLDIINGIIQSLGKLATNSFKIDIADAYTSITQRYYFSTNEQLQLQKLLSRWGVLTDQDEINLPIIEAKTGKAFLSELNQKLDQLPFNL